MFYALLDAKNMEKPLNEWICPQFWLVLMLATALCLAYEEFVWKRTKKLFCGFTVDIIFLDNAFGLKIICRTIFVVGTICATWHPVSSFVQIVAEECRVFINLLSWCSFPQNNRNILVCKSAKRNMMQTNLSIKMWLSYTRSCTKE